MGMKRTYFVSLVIGLVTLTSCFDDPPAFRTFEEQLEIDKELIESYLLENDISALEHTSGIFYTINEEGEGDVPKGTDEIEFDYEGRLLTDDIFDSSFEEEVKPIYPLNGLIYAWQVMIPLISEGGNITIYAPSVYCYGSGSRPGIPANSSLIFEIYLLEINP